MAMGLLAESRSLDHAATMPGAGSASGIKPDPLMAGERQLFWDRLAVTREMGKRFSTLRMQSPSSIRTIVA